MYNFDKVIDRTGTGSVKYESQGLYGVKSGLLPFWIADTDFETLPEITQAIKERCEHPLFGYTAPTDNCLEAVQDWFKRRYDWEIEKSWIIFSTGIVTALSFTIKVLTRPGDKILIFTPVYDPFFRIIKNSNRTLVDHQLIRKDNSFFIDFEKLEQDIEKGVKAIILCNPHNPVGRVWTHRELEDIAGLCKKYQVYVLSDDIHCDITLFGNTYTPITSFTEIGNLLITYTAISKTFNMAGLSSSSMIIQDKELRKNVTDALSSVWIFGPNALALTAIEAAYNFGDRWVDEQNAYLSENSRYVTDFFVSHMPDIGVSRHEGTFLMWLDFNCLNMTSKQLSDIMAKEYNLALGIGSNYGIQADGFMRFNIGCPKVILEQGVNLIHRLYKDMRSGQCTSILD